MSHHSWYRLMHFKTTNQISAQVLPGSLAQLELRQSNLPHTPSCSTHQKDAARGGIKNLDVRSIPEKQDDLGSSPESHMYLTTQTSRKETPRQAS